MTGNILARQWHPRLGTSTDEAIRVPILIVAPQSTFCRSPGAPSTDSCAVEEGALFVCVIGVRQHSRWRTNADCPGTFQIDHKLTRQLWSNSDHLPSSVPGEITHL